MIIAPCICSYLPATSLAAPCTRGPFAADQIEALVVPIDPDYKKPLQHILDKSVCASRIERRSMTPEVTRARLEWLKVYGAAKLIVEGVLKLYDKSALLPEVFDDLAEVHGVNGVADEAPPPAPGELSSAPPAG